MPRRRRASLQNLYVWPSVGHFLTAAAAIAAASMDLRLRAFTAATTVEISGTEMARRLSSRQRRPHGTPLSSYLTGSDVTVRRRRR